MKTLKEKIIRLAYNKPDLREHLLPLVLSSSKTFKCPNCDTKVLEDTKYCVKCEKKVKKESSLSTAAGGEGTLGSSLNPASTLSAKLLDALKSKGFTIKAGPDARDPHFGFVLETHRTYDLAVTFVKKRDDVVVRLVDQMSGDRKYENTFGAGDDLSSVVRTLTKEMARLVA